MTKSFKELFIEHDSMAKPIQKGKSVFILCMVIVTIVNFLVFYVAVNVNSFLLAFQEYVGKNEYVTSFYQFKKFFHEISLGMNGEILPAFLNTMMYFWSGLLISLPLSYFIGYFLFKKIFMYRFFRVIFFMPSIISGVVLVVMFRYILSQNSSLDYLLQETFGAQPFPDFFDTSSKMNKMMLIFTIWTGFGTNVILFQGTMKRIPESVLEAAKLDGANITVELFKIITPMVWPTIMTMLTLNFSAFLTASGPIMLFTNGKDTNTYTISFWLYWIGADQNAYHYASAASIILTIVACPIAFTARGLLNKLYEPVEY